MSMILKQKLSVQVYQLFRTAGFTLNLTQTDQLQGVSDKIAELIEATAKETAVELIRKMQEAVGAGFTAIGKDVSAIEARLNDLEAYNTSTESGLQKLRDEGKL